MQRVQLELSQAAGAVGFQLALVDQGVTQLPLLRHPAGSIDEARREVDACDRIEVACELEAGAPGCAAQIERTPRRTLLHCLNGEPGQRTREIGDPEVLVAIVELKIL